MRVLVFYLLLSVSPIFNYASCFRIVESLNLSELRKVGQSNPVQSVFVLVPIHGNLMTHAKRLAKTVYLVQYI